MDSRDIIFKAITHIKNIKWTSFDILNIAKPNNLDEAVDLSKQFKIISKISPLVGNLLEHKIADILNLHNNYYPNGLWRRQDPGFPDIIFDSDIVPNPGFEVKAWYPFSTEITGRFKDSQNHFKNDQTYVIILAWLPEYIIYGRPTIVDLQIISGASIAVKRDNHYHNPPHYLVTEPHDTSDRTSNLQQTNTNGYVFQDNKQAFVNADSIVCEWGEESRIYQPSLEYQEKMRQLLNSYKYRLDTNYSKLDRIQHPEIEEFKSRVLNVVVCNDTIRNWFRLFSSFDNDVIISSLQKNIML